MSALQRSAKLVAFGLAVAIRALSTSEAWACPGCKQAIADSSENVIAAWQFSILFMMAMPFTVVGCVAAGIVLMYRKASQMQASSKRQPQTHKETGN